MDGYKRIADLIGLNFVWLVEGEGEPYRAAQPIRPLDRQSVLTAIETILERLLLLDQATSRSAALKILNIVERPPDDNSSTDTKDKIRIAILGALRVYEHP
jgi:hypothetical protein